VKTLIDAVETLVELGLTIAQTCWSTPETRRSAASAT
jgi:hypothetical protein